MRIGWVAAAAATLAVTGCSSGPPDFKPGPGMLVAGTAQLAVNGQNIGTTKAVHCTAAGPLTTVTTGDQTAGVTALVSNKDDLIADAVSINNIGGFTGSYNKDLGGQAKVTMTGRTYDISGTADGFDTANPSFRTTGTFAIKVAC